MADRYVARGFRVVKVKEGMRATTRGRRVRVKLYYCTIVPLLPLPHHVAFVFVRARATCLLRRPHPRSLSLALSVSLSLFLSISLSTILRYTAYCVESRVCNMRNRDGRGGPLMSTRHRRSEGLSEGRISLDKSTRYKSILRHYFLMSRSRRFARFGEKDSFEETKRCCLLLTL